MKAFLCIVLIMNVLVCLMCIYLFIKRRDTNELVIAIYAAAVSILIAVS